MGEIGAPSLLLPEHDLSQFNSGNETLNEWLKKRALKNQTIGASRTFVIGVNSHAVIGYYALATGGVERIAAPGSFARGMPEPIPVIVLARLAIDQRYQGQRLGGFLLKDALQRALNVSNQVGVRGVLVHAISEEAKKFYLRYGFVESPFEQMTLMISMKTLLRYFGCCHGPRSNGDQLHHLSI